jgi:hypothetical protein
MLEYRAFELTQTNLAVLASQHLPNATALVNKDRFEAPDLLLPSLQKPGEKQLHKHSTVRVEGPDSEEGERDTGLDDEDEEDEDYGEEYDDTRTFTVKDFKEQALRYAREHYQTKLERNNHDHNTSSHAINTPAAE